MSDAILDKVRKLLAKAEDPACTPAEAEAFTAKAAELIAKYGVDSALLAAADPAADPVGDLVVEVLSSLCAGQVHPVGRCCRGAALSMRPAPGLVRRAQNILDAPVRS